MLAFLAAAFHTVAVASAVVVENRLEGNQGHLQRQNLIDHIKKMSQRCLDRSNMIKITT